MTTKPVRDALLFRDVQDGVWDVCRVTQARMPAYLEAGWRVLITEAELRANDIADAYMADLVRPFNRPRMPR